MHFLRPVFFWYLEEDRGERQRDARQTGQSTRATDFVAISSSSTEAFISRPTVSRLYSTESSIVPCSTTMSPKSRNRSASSVIDLAMFVISFVRRWIVASIRAVGWTCSVYQRYGRTVSPAVEGTVGIRLGRTAWRSSSSATISFSRDMSIAAPDILSSPSLLLT